MSSRLPAATTTVKYNKSHKSTMCPEKKTKERERGISNKIKHTKTGSHLPCNK